MALVVQKYGGTSVGDAHKIKDVARRVAATREAGNDVVVVVSAMGHSTDELVGLAGEISPAPFARELDMLLTAGERISMALLSMAIIEEGHEAISFTGSQAGIVTDTSHGRARIIEVRARRVLEAVEAGKIAIIAGFQGVSTESDVTTLGRGGSDTTAVAMAAAMDADLCEIYTDVDGVFTADPRIVPDARKLHAVSYEEMLEMSAAGAKVLMLRSVEYARNYGVLVHVRCSFHDREGTWIREEDERMEQAIISGVVADVSEAKVTIRSVSDRPGVAARLFKTLAAESVNVDMIVQNVSAQGHTDISFTAPKEDLRRTEALLDSTAKEIGCEGVTTDAQIAKVSLVGAGMKTNPGVAADMFDALAGADINIQIISTSSIRISCVVHEREADQAVRAIHDRFELPDEAMRREEHPETATDQFKIRPPEDLDQGTGAL
jgi:aspartate kinase